MWEVDGVVYHAVERGSTGLLEVTAERLVSNGVFRNWPKVFRPLFPVLSKNAARTCGSQYRSCVVATADALDKAGVPVIFVKLFQAIHTQYDR